MKIERFEDIQAWEEARVLAKLVYGATEIGTFAKDFGLRDQIREAAGSVMHNIAEGFEDGSDFEFMRFLKYARRSASEVQSESYLALDSHYVTLEQFQKMYDQATKTKKLINAFIAYLNKSKNQKTTPTNKTIPTIPTNPTNKTIPTTPTNQTIPTNPTNQTIPTNPTNQTT